MRIYLLSMILIVALGLVSVEGYYSSIYAEKQLDEYARVALANELITQTERDVSRARRRIDVFAESAKPEDATAIRTMFGTVGGLLQQAQDQFVSPARKAVVGEMIVKLTSVTTFTEAFKAERIALSAASRAVDQAYRQYANDIPPNPTSEPAARLSRIVLRVHSASSMLALTAVEPAQLAWQLVVSEYREALQALPVAATTQRASAEAVFRAAEETVNIGSKLRGNTRVQLDAGLQDLADTGRKVKQMTADRSKQLLDASKSRSGKFRFTMKGLSIGEA